MSFDAGAQRSLALSSVHTLRESRRVLKGQSEIHEKGRDPNRGDQDRFGAKLAAASAGTDGQPPPVVGVR